MDVVAAEAAADAAAEQESTRELQRSQEEAALAASRLQRMRAQRVRRLKVPIWPLPACRALRQGIMAGGAGSIM